MHILQNSNNKQIIALQGGDLLKANLLHPVIIRVTRELLHGKYVFSIPEIQYADGSQTPLTSDMMVIEDDIPYQYFSVTQDNKNEIYRLSLLTEDILKWESADPEKLKFHIVRMPPTLVQTKAAINSELYVAEKEKQLAAYEIKFRSAIQTYSLIARSQPKKASSTKNEVSLGVENELFEYTPPTFIKPLSYMQRETLNESFPYLFPMDLDENERADYLQLLRAILNNEEITHQVTGERIKKAAQVIKEGLLPIIINKMIFRSEFLPGAASDAAPQPPPTIGEILSYLRWLIKVELKKYDPSYAIIPDTELYINVDALNHRINGHPMISGVLNPEEEHLLDTLKKIWIEGVNCHIDYPLTILRKISWLLNSFVTGVITPLERALLDQFSLIIISRRGEDDDLSDEEDEDPSLEEILEVAMADLSEKYQQLNEIIEQREEKLAETLEQLNEIGEIDDLAKLAQALKLIHPESIPDVNDRLNQHFDTIFAGGHATLRELSTHNFKWISFSLFITNNLKFFIGKTTNLLEVSYIFHWLDDQKVENFPFLIADHLPIVLMNANDLGLLFALFPLSKLVEC